MLARTIAPLFLVTALVASGCAASGAPRWTYSSDGSGRLVTPGPATVAPTTTTAHAHPSATAPAQPTAVSQPTAQSGGAGASAGGFTIEAYDLGFQPAVIEVASAGVYDVALRNTGAIGHDLTFADGTKITAAATETATASVTIPEGGMTFLCSIPGHSDAGMKGEVKVTGQAPVAPSSSAPSEPPAMPGMSMDPVESAVPSTPTSPAATMDPNSHGGPPPTVAGVDPDPNAAAYRLFDATAPAPLPGTTHDIDLVMTEGKMTVAPGYVVNVWTFGGTVPGPVIRVKVGDTVRIHLKNPATNTMSHSIDFHASQVAWNDEMTSIAPGEEKLYEWTADYAGVWMYHCGTTPALHHIANGMYGMVIVDPAQGLPPVDAEYALVQSEWYLGPQGEPVSLEKASSAAPAPDLVVFNGVFNQYKDHPLVVDTNDRVRFFVLDVGPNIDSSFHIVGTIFDRVIKEGATTDAATNGGWASQAVDLAPAQGAVIELSPKEDGLYPIVTHAFNFVGRGALGLLQAGDGDPLN